MGHSSAGTGADAEQPAVGDKPAKQGAGVEQPGGAARLAVGGNPAKVRRGGAEDPAGDADDEACRGAD